MKMNSHLRSILLTSALAVFGLGIGGCKDGRHLRFWVSPESAQVLRELNNRLQDRSAGLALKCNSKPSTRDGRVACMFIAGSVSEHTIQVEEVGHPLRPERLAVRITGGSQRLMRALYESLEGAAPLEHRVTGPKDNPPHAPFTAYKLFLENDQFEIFCTHGRTPLRVDHEYDCLALLYQSVLTQ